MLLVALTVIGLTGCGGGPAYDGPRRFPLSGSVTFDGEPVTGGMISFVPEDGKSNPAGGPIEDGTFTIAEEKGANPGPYRVLVYWHKPTGKQIQDSDTGETVDEVRQVIPPEFNGNTSLSVNVTDDPEQNVFEFDLQPK
ncbi:hypothetical protein [Maioricimonas rarisocia]|nr:hypothetical protein [Maioricimonas rarisocia]